jgi:hypothetical protein
VSVTVDDHVEMNDGNDVLDDRMLTMSEWFFPCVCRVYTGSRVYINIMKIFYSAKSFFLYCTTTTSR